ncbi:MAG: DUF3883 domain-containing protein [Methylococcales symbiont of Hymedesmia sp. n. MRB-2018]|nr:MAG: DUF3883 domain-containing protein [Methylococcales symbiont of Hymedesmia sp. n. MRB-2018]
METRKKSILSGLFLSKFDKVGLTTLGFNSHTEAFNAIGLALNVKSTSIKLYRDEFDSLFPHRKGWERKTRQYCMDVYNSFKDLKLDEFTNLLKTIIYNNSDLDILAENTNQQTNENNSFAKRLITGQAAENYFQENYNKIDIFKPYELEDTTKLGCGFDFKLHKNNDYIGVEVKGLNGKNGSISLTNKEYNVAKFLHKKYFLFVVKNFREKPQHNYYQNPLKTLPFNKIEQKITQISWNTNVSA